jgi:sulfopyruvate decarboxylase subunit beta
MLRLDCLRSVYSKLETCLVVTIMGAVAAELQSLGHHPNFFYLQHAMGLASSTGLGLSLCLPEQRVIVFDGDGSLLMNLGSLSTMARYRPRNWCTSFSTTKACSRSAVFQPQPAQARTWKGSPAALAFHE